MDNGRRGEKKTHSKCNLCDAQFKSAREKEAHRSSQLHTFMTGIKRTQLSYLGDAKTLKDQIAEIGKKEPLIGLEYIYEYKENSEGLRMYECKLCESAYRPEDIFFHIVGIQHRVLYLVKHHPIMGIEAGFQVQQLVHYRKLSNNALAIEQTHGRKKINVANVVYVSQLHVHEISDSDSDAETPAGDPGKAGDRGKGGANGTRTRSRDDRQRDRGRESRRDSGDAPRFPGRDHNEDLNARTQPNSKTAKVGPDAKGAGSSAQPSKDGVPPLPSPAVPPAGSKLPLIGGGRTDRDDFQDTDFRQRKVDRGGSSALRDRGGDRKGDTRDQNRRRSRSPKPRERSPRPRSRFDVGRGGDIDVRSVLPSGGISFRELRMAHFRNIRGGFSSAHLPLHQKKDKDTDSDMEVCSMDFSDCDPDDFWCNEELFEFLKSYYIRDDESVQFIMDAIKLMSEALLRHKARKEDLQKRILEEKQRLEDEKQKFLQMTKRKKEKITSTAMRSVEPQNVKLFNQVTGTKNTISSGTDPAAQPPKGEKVQQGTGAQPGAAPVAQPAGQKPHAKKVKQPLLPLPTLAAAGPLLQQLFVRPLAPQNVTQPPLTPAAPKLLMGVRAPAPPPPLLSLTPQGSFSQTPLFRFGVGPPAGGAGLGAGFNQGNSAPRFDHPNPLKDPRNLVDQGDGRYAGTDNSFAGNEFPGSWGENSGSLDKTKPPSGAGSDSRFNQNAQFPSSWGDNSGSLDKTKPPLGAGSDNRFNQNAQFPGSWGDNSGSLDKTKPPLGAGSETRNQIDQNQIKQNRVSRFDNPRPMVGPGAGSYSGSDSRFNQNAQFPGSWGDNSGSLDKTKPPLGAGSETRFNQNPQNRASRFDNPNPSKAPRPMVGQGAGSYSGSDRRFNQNAQFPGSWRDNSGSLDQTKPPSGADLNANYNAMQWNSGPQSGDQDFYNEPRPTTGMGAGRYEDEYNQNQWQSQVNSRGTYGSGMSRPLGSQGPQPTASPGYSSDRHQGTWPGQNPQKTGAFPAGILKNRTGNLP